MSDAIFALAASSGQRSITVVKARATAHDIRSHAMTIGIHGVQVDAQ
jgi:hypothetical protein